ncbi:hypothetical protein GQ457_10G004010 [Hibiscus cannabinus]
MEWISPFKNNPTSSTMVVYQWWFNKFKLAWSYGFEVLLIQTDCSEVPKLLLSTPTSSPYSLVRAIARLMSRAWSIDFQVIKREANSAADHLAKLSLGSDNQKLVMDSPPTSLVPLLSRDVHGPPYVRTARTIHAQAAQAP